MDYFPNRKKSVLSRFNSVMSAMLSIHPSQDRNPLIPLRVLPQSHFFHLLICGCLSHKNQCVRPTPLYYFPAIRQRNKRLLMQIACRVFPLPPFIPKQRNKNIISLRLTMLSPHVDSQLCNGDLHATEEQPSVARKAAKIFPLYCTPFAAQASVARHLPLLCLHPSAPATVIPETFPTDAGSPASV